ncbi:MAG: methyltransferase domain-containing protein, partial [Planctomycetes bacterium]|nr:methyltransferase domain-containing protein [Planctomycetota bacterium]
MIRLALSRRLLGSPTHRRLNLGCGSRRHADWTNVDLVPAGPDVIASDLRQPLAFAAGSFEAVYAAHVLEHLEPVEARRLVAEMHRLLAAGGVVRIVVPDLEGIVRSYLASLERAAADTSLEARWEHRWMTVELVDQLVRATPGGLMRRWWSCDPVPARAFIERRLGQEAAEGIAAAAAARDTRGEPPLDSAEIFAAEPPSARAASRYTAHGERHRWMYDRVSLADLLEDAGFRDVRTVTAGDSRIPGFAAACLDAD